MATKAGDLKPAPYNPRTITDEELEMLAASMRRFGDMSGVVRNLRTGHVVGGHQRLKKIPPDAPIVIVERYPEPNEQGTVAVGYIIVNGERWSYREVEWDLATEMAANVAANQHGGRFDMPRLAEVIRELERQQFDLSLTGFTEEQLKELREWEPPKVSGGGDDDEEEPQPKFTGIYAYNEDAILPSSNKWGIPDLREDMLSDRIVTTTWVTGHPVTDPDHTLYIYRSGKPPEELRGRGVIGFYRDDAYIEDVWADAVKILDRFKEFGWAALLTPDFSIWRDNPLALQLYNIYRSRWCGRYWQEAGFKVIPSLNWGDERTDEWANAGIPRGAPVVYVQCRTDGGSRSSAGRRFFERGFRVAMEQIDPQCVVIYGGEENRSWVEPCLPPGREYVFVPSWTRLRWARGRK